MNKLIRLIRLFETKSHEWYDEPSCDATANRYYRQMKRLARIILSLNPPEHDFVGMLRDVVEHDYSTDSLINDVGAFTDEYVAQLTVDELIDGSWDPYSFAVFIARHALECGIRNNGSMNDSELAILINMKAAISDLDR